MMIRDENYITLLGYIKNRLNFDDLEEYTIYSIIHGMSQSKHGVFDGSIEYLSEWINASVDTARRKLKSLEVKGYITSTQRAGKSTLYQSVILDETEGLTPRKLQGVANCNPPQNATPPPANCKGNPPQNATPHLKYNNKNNSDSDSAHTPTREVLSFDTWWALYDYKEKGSQKSRCERRWNAMTDAERKRVMAHTEAYIRTHIKGGKTYAERRKEPLYYLDYDEEWKDEIDGSPPNIHYLEGWEIEENTKAGIKMVMVITAEGLHKIVTAADAKKYNLQIEKDF